MSFMGSGKCELGTEPDQVLPLACSIYAKLGLPPGFSSIINAYTGQWFQFSHLTHGKKVNNHIFYSKCPILVLRVKRDCTVD